MNNISKVQTKKHDREKKLMKDTGKNAPASIIAPDKQS